MLSASGESVVQIDSKVSLEKCKPIKIKIKIDESRLYYPE